jgi:DNA-binding LytR/AlgR family response regulator
MKIRIELDPTLTETEIIIRASRLDDSITKIQDAIGLASAGASVTYWIGEIQYFPRTEEILFFETEGDEIFAHTCAKAYRVKLRLYELQEQLPRYFCRISKSAIVNTRRIYSVNQTLPGSAQLEFTGTHKHIFVSRRYLGSLRLALEGQH